MKSIQVGMHDTIAKLYMIDDVSNPLRAKFVIGNDSIIIPVMIIALISVGLAVVSVYNKLCHEFIGYILLVVSVLSFLCSLIIT